MPLPPTLSYPDHQLNIELAGRISHQVLSDIRSISQEARGLTYPADLDSRLVRIYTLSDIIHNFGENFEFKMANHLAGVLREAIERLGARYTPYLDSLYEPIEEDDQCSVEHNLPKSKN